MRNFGKILFLSAFCLLAAVESFSQAAQYRLGIAYGSNLYSNKERFEFSVDGERVILNSANPTVYFNKKFSNGQRYQIQQVFGPRTCNLWNVETGVFNNQDIVIAANCGNPPLTLFKLEITGVEQGESFKFADNYRRTLTSSFSTTVNLGGFPQGDDYSITQTDGPRQCK
ncbi:MAG: hypothetical protein HC846_01320, partial [Blastocatellia bacterium]|nr:hypothetical protein [Blastocatellia bacterium]